MRWRWLYLTGKWLLIALGAYLWTALWFERHWALGVLQLLWIGYLIALPAKAAPPKSSPSR